MSPGRVLIIAGSDSSGGAGLEADQKVIAAHGCYAMTATTALTAQNTVGIHGVHVVPADFVGKQIDACVGDIGVDVVKTGMLAGADTIEMVSKRLALHKISQVVVDPVMVSTSGAQLLPQDAVDQLCRHLLPLTTVLTPNIPEAARILSSSGLSAVGADDNLRSVADLEAAARKIRGLGPRWVLVKGGHLPLKADLTAADGPAESKFVVDVLVGPGEADVLRLQRPWQESMSTHGTGCSLASAIASGLANGNDVPSAVQAACRYVEAGIRTAPKLGSGHGPLNHFHSTYTLPFAPGHFLEYLLTRSDVKQVWDTYVNHPFVMAMGDGTLPLESFKGYMIQDYIFLLHSARLQGLAAYKTQDLGKIEMANKMAGLFAQETKLHVAYCESFGIPREDILATDEQQACTAYTRYVLDVGQSEDWFALQVAISPCLLGYAAVGRMLKSHARTKRDGNPYWRWIETYSGEDYDNSVQIGSQLLEEKIILQSPNRIEELIKIFITATRMETGFWEMFPYKRVT